MREIPLANGGVTQISDEDHPSLSAWEWRSRERGNTIYAVRWDNDRQAEIGMHRYILGHPENLTVDHKDGNGLNNTRENLRACTPKQNFYNSRTPKNNTSGLKGVRFRKDRGTWRAVVGHKLPGTWSAQYLTKWEAAIAYNNAALRMYGEFARLNEIPDEYKDVVPIPLDRGWKAFKTCVSGYFGVRKMKHREVYEVNVIVEGQHVYIGRFVDPFDAAYVYDQAKIQLIPETRVFNVLDKEPNE